jgi:hypothetical protein
VKFATAKFGAIEGVCLVSFVDIAAFFMDNREYVASDEDLYAVGGSFLREAPVGLSARI